MSSSSDDEGFDEDMEALRRACFLSGTEPNSILLRSSAAVSAVSLPESDGDDDLELVRGIRKRFSNDEPPLTLKPLSVLLPNKVGVVDDDDDGEDDDFAILRSIKKRFSRYDNDMLDNNNEKQGKVCSNSTYSEKGTSNNARPAKTNAASTYALKINVPKPKAVPNSLDMRYTHNSEKVDTPPITEAVSSCFTEGRDMDTQDSSITEAFLPCFTEGRDIDTHDSTMVSTEGSDFPKAAQMFVEAIRKNRACQKFIRNKMMKIEARIEENKKLQHRVKTLRGFQIKCKKETSRALSQKLDARYQLISTVKLKGKSKADFKDSVLCHGPAENSHVGCYRMVFAEYHTSLSRRKWTDEERENLVKGIKQQFQELLLQRSVDSISEMEGDPNDIDDIYASIREHDITPESMRSFLPKVNWERLASMYVTGRSGAECETRWLNCEDPLINHKPWTSSEDKELLRILQERGISNWIEISVLLGTNRTPFQCLARYQRSLNASILKSEWTKDEDEKLCDAVATFGESNWENVAATLVGRTGPQCSNRWIKSLNPAREITGRWSLDEDKRLKIAVVFFGKNWKKVADFVPGRTHVQCRERWANCLDPNLKMGDWTEEEDNKLKEAIAEFGYCWSKVAASVASRTDNQCTRRWKVLFPNEVRKLQVDRKMRKAALISNFVDRETERPALGPDDFIPLILPNADSESAELNKSGKKQKNKPRFKKSTKNAITGEKHPKKERTRRCKNKAAPEVAETLGVGQEIVQFDGIVKIKPIRIRKVESRAKNVTKKSQKDESLSTKGGQKSSSKKNTRASKKKKEASEATENARNYHVNAVPFDGQTNTRKTSRKRKMTSRYENAIKEALICTDEIPLTYRVDIEEVAGQKTNVNKKPTRLSKKDKETSEATDARVGQEVFDGQTKKDKSARKHSMPSREGLKEKNTVATSKSLLKKIDVPTNSNLSASGNSEVITMTTLEEEHNGKRAGKKNKTIFKLGRTRKEPPKRFDEGASSFRDDEAFSEVKDQYADPTEVNSSPFLNIAPLRRINVHEATQVADFGKRKKCSVISRSNRIKCRALLREVFDVTEISDSETLGSILMKKRKTRRNLKTQSGLNHSLKSGSIINKEVDAMNGRGLVSDIVKTTKKNKSVRYHSYSHGEREGHKPQARKSENAELGEKRKRLNNDKQLSNVVQFGKEGDDMILATLFKKKHEKRRVNFAPKTPPFDELPNRPSSIGHVDEAADSDTCSPPPGFGEPVYKASHLELA